jgi:AcrR family transcriptional regulator
MKEPILKQPDITRQKILQAAFAEIYQQGFQAASLGAILQRAQVTKGALYHHFSDKKTLGLAVLEEIIYPRIQQIWITPLQIEQNPTPLSDVIQAILTAIAFMTSSNLNLGCPFNNLLQEMSPIDDDFRLSLNGFFELWQNTLIHALKQAQTLGQIRADINATDTALFIIASTEGCIGIAKNMQCKQSLQQCSQVLIQFINSLKVP